MQNMIKILNDRTSLKGNIIKILNLLIAVLKSFDKKSASTVLAGALIGGIPGALIGSMKNVSYTQYGIEFKDGKKTLFFIDSNNILMGNVLKELKEQNKVDMNLGF